MRCITEARSEGKYSVTRGNEEPEPVIATPLENGGSNPLSFS
jgi:hypothetical protein